MTTLGTAVLKIDTDDKELGKGLDSAKQKAGGLGDVLGRVAGTAGGFAAYRATLEGLRGSFSFLVGNAMDFDASLRAVQSSTGATTEEMQKMRAAALQIGKDTPKSASDAVAAMGEMVKAGVPVATVLDGAAMAAVNMASATGIEVPQAAVLMAQALNTFSASGLKAEDAATLFAKAANASAIDVNDMGLSLQAVGPVAAQAGMTMTDFSTAIGIMGNHALRGSDAGTSLKTMLLSLMAPSSAKAKDEMKALGVSIFDASGETRNFRDVLGDLQKSLAGATDQQRAQALSTIFGTDAIRAANILLDEGTAGWDAFGASMEAAPSLAEQTATRMGGLSGAIEQFKGSLETLSIMIGSKLLPVLTMLAVLGTKALNWLIDALTVGPIAQAFAVLAKAIGQVIDALDKAGVIDAFTGALDDIWKVLQPLLESKEAMIALSGAMAYLAAVGLTVLIAALVSATVALYGFITAMVIAAAPFVAVAAVVGLVVLSIYELYKNFDLIKEKAADVWGAVGKYIEAALAILFLVPVLIGTAVYEAITHWQELKQSTMDAWDAIKAAPGQALDAILGALTSAWAAIRSGATAAWDAVKSVISGALDWIVANVTAKNIGQVIGDILFAPIRALRFLIQDAIPAIVSAVVSLVTGMANAITSGISTAAKAVETFFTSTLPNFITSSVSAVVGAATSLGKSAIDALWAAVQAAWAAVATFFSSTLPNFITSTIPAAVASAASWGRQVVESIWSAIQSAWSAVTNGVPALISQLWLLAERGAQDFVDIGERIVQGIWNGIKNLAGWLRDQVTNFVGGLVDAAKSAAGISSPSKEGIFIGEMFVAGIAQGLQSMRDLAMPTLMAPILDGGLAAAQQAASTARSGQPGDQGPRSGGETFQFNAPITVMANDPAEFFAELKRMQTRELQFAGRGVSQ